MCNDIDVVDVGCGLFNYIGIYDENVCFFYFCCFDFCCIGVVVCVVGWLLVDLCWSEGWDGLFCGCWLYFGVGL